MAEGQYTGVRATYIYETDDGRKILISTDKTLGDIPNNGLIAATTGNSGEAGAKPSRFEPRVVFWQGTGENIGKKKRIICGDVTASLYASSISQALTIDGIAGVTTGKRGEKLTFLKLAAAPATPPAT
jgi:hypothetical protein